VVGVPVIPAQAGILLRYRLVFALTRLGRLCSGHFGRLPAPESLSLCWLKEKVTKEK